MTAPVAPMEARCAVCLDTGSKSQQIEGMLDCTACSAADERVMVNNFIREKFGFCEFATQRAAWAAYLFAQRQAAPVAQQPATMPVHEADQLIELAGALEQEWLRKTIAELRGSVMLNEGGFKAGFDTALEEIEARCNLVAHVAQPAQQVEAVGQDDKWRKMCHEISDIWEDGNMPEDERTYASEAWPDQMAELKDMVAHDHYCPVPQLEAQQAGDVALKEAVGKFIKAKGRFHTEQNYAALVAAYDAIAQGRKA